jgi:hypothetical protein
MDKFISPALLLVIHTPNTDSNTLEEKSSDAAPDKNQRVLGKSLPPHTSMAASHDLNPDQPETRFDNPS